MARFTEHARPALPGLRAQAIHNDLNLYNVLVDPGITTSSPAS